MTTPSLRRSVAIFAMLALAVLLLRPACDVLGLDLAGSQAGALSALHHAETGDVSNAGSHDASLATVAKAAGGLPVAAAALSVVLVVAALVFLSRVAAPSAAPPPRSYYARTARILR